MCCADLIVKYVLFFFNLVFVLAGLALIGLGTAVLVHLGDVRELIPVIETIPILVIVVGCIVFLISFFGCCGAIRESRCLLILYAVCMLILAALKIWLAVVIFNNLSRLTTTIQNLVDTAFRNHGHQEQGLFRALETVFRCCGTTGVVSYENLQFIPSTCCANPYQSTGCIGADTFYDGCSEIFTDYLNTFGDIVGVVIIIIICLELIAVIFALFLNQRITSANRIKRY